MIKAYYYIKPEFYVAAPVPVSEGHKLLNTSRQNRENFMIMLKYFNNINGTSGSAIQLFIYSYKDNFL